MSLSCHCGTDRTQLLGIALLPSSTAYKWDKWGLYLMAVTCQSTSRSLAVHSFVIPMFSAWALISSNTAGRTKRSVISSTTFIAYW
jgi:ACS family allantoate permease-like MFS transporter